MAGGKYIGENLAAGSSTDLQPEEHQTRPYVWRPVVERGVLHPEKLQDNIKGWNIIPSAGYEQVTSNPVMDHVMAAHPFLR